MTCNGMGRYILWNIFIRLVRTVENHEAKKMLVNVSYIPSHAFTSHVTFLLLIYLIH